MKGPADISNALGWMSIACWVIVYTPQIHENYVLKSGEGLSVIFVVVWLIGDSTNLAGAVLGDLLPTMIYLAVYYLICDLILLGQIYWYRRTHPVHPVLPGPVPSVVLSAPVEAHARMDEETPLLLVQKPVMGRKKDTLLQRLSFYVVTFGLVLGTGYVVYWFDDPGEGKTGKPEWRSQLLGWISAVLYLSSRIPQIYKNFETKCEGLSLGFFVFAIMGNVTYVSSIIVASNGRDQILANLPWLAGNMVAILFDLFVLCQFFYFRSADPVFLTDGQLEDEGLTLSTDGR